MALLFLEAVSELKRRNHSMNWDQVAGSWKQTKGKIREKWGKLTDDDLDVIAGKRDQLVGRLQERYGMARDEAQREADSYVAGLSEGRTEARRAASPKY